MAIDASAQTRPEEDGGQIAAQDDLVEGAALIQLRNYAADGM